MSDRPVLVYDGRCRFCVREAGRLARWAGGRVRLESFREPGVLERHGLDAAACEAAIHLVEPDGRITSGAAAVARTLRLRPLFAPLGWLHEIPVVRALLDAAYRVVSRNRFRLGGEVCADDTCRPHA